MANERPFVLQWRSAVLNSAEDASVKLSLLALAEFADKAGGHAIPGFPALASMTSQNEKTCRRAFEQADGKWFTRRQVKLAGKDWRAYEYTLRMPEGADTVTARSRKGADTVTGANSPRSGHEGNKVRTLEADGAGTVSTVLGSKQGKDKQGKSNNAPLLTFQEFLDQKPKGERFISPDDSIFGFVEDAGIPDEFHTLAWLAFKLRFKESSDRCVDWRERYRRSIREDWFKLWRFDTAANEYVLTNAGEQVRQWQEANE